MSPAAHLPHCHRWSSLTGWRLTCVAPEVADKLASIWNTCHALLICLRCCVTQRSSSHEAPPAPLPASSLPHTYPKKIADKLVERRTPLIRSLMFLIVFSMHAVLWLKTRVMKLKQLDYRRSGTFTSQEQRTLIPKAVRTGKVKTKSGSFWFLLVVQWSLRWFKYIYNMETWLIKCLWSFIVTLWVRNRIKINRHFIQNTITN